MSLTLVAVLISVIFCFLCCQLYQCRRRKKPTEVGTTGTLGADTYHFDQDCHYIQNKSTKKKFFGLQALRKRLQLDLNGILTSLLMTLNL
jgi:hypothetical protein